MIYTFDSQNHVQTGTLVRSISFQSTDVSGLTGWSAPRHHAYVLYHAVYAHMCETVCM